MDMNHLNYDVHWDIRDSNGNKVSPLVWLDTKYYIAYQELEQKFEDTKNPHEYFLVTGYHVYNGILTVIGYEDNKLYEYHIYYNLDENKFEFVKGVEWKLDDRSKFFTNGTYIRRKMLYTERNSGYKCASVEDIIKHLKVNIFYGLKPTVEFK